MHTQIQTWLMKPLIILFTLILIACSGGGGGSDGPTITGTGKFVDGPVKGLKYRTRSVSGETDINGMFRYVPGEEITFSYAGVDLGTAIATDLMTPWDLVKGEDLELSKLALINMLRLLQSLDSNKNHGDGIQLYELAEVVVNVFSINFYQDILVFENDYNLNIYLTNIAYSIINVDVINLISAQEAVNNFNDTISTEYPEIIIPIDLNLDTDGDGEEDASDNCPLISNPNQENADNDSAGDACDAFPNDSSESLDSDGDSIGDNADNCPVVANADQLDTDNDQQGDACDSDDDREPDTTPPVTSLNQDTAPPSLTNQTSASFSFGADEAGASFECQINDSAVVPCVSPVIYQNISEGAHEFYVWAIDQAGNRDLTPEIHSWIIDITLPVLTISSNPPTLTNQARASFIFTANEALQKFECSLNNSEFSVCQSPVLFEGLAEGSHSFRVRAIDLASNTGPAVEYIWTVDTVAPGTEITDNPSTITNQSDASFVFGATEADSTFECSIDGSAFSICESPKGYSNLSEAEHTFRVQATDLAGNTDETPEVFIWVVDRTDPISTIDEKPQEYTNQRSASFTFSADEAIDHFECSFNNAAFAQCESGVSYTDLEDGVYSFRVLAIDLASNTGAAAEHAWTVDTVTPETTINDEPSSISNSASASFSFTSNEPESTFECTLDGVDFNCESSVELSNLSEGLHNFSVRAIDRAGNIETEAESRAWTVDTAPPVTTIISNPGNPSYESTASFEFSAEEGSTFECSIDSGAFESCNSPKVFDNLSDAEHIFNVRATDSAGNVELNAAYYTWTVDTSPHTLDALAQTVAVQGGSIVDITLTATDSRDHSLSFVLSNSEVPTKGTLSGLAPNLSYTPDAVCNTTDSFNFTATDGELSSEATISIIIFCDYYDISGTISGLAGGSVAISLNDTETITLPANGAFSFTGTLHWGESYSVEVVNQPVGQECSIANASGIASENVTDITVTCMSAPVTIFSENFESGGASWSSPEGIWEIGQASFGPSSCIQGAECAGTVLDGNYPDEITGYLVSPSILLPNIEANEEIQLRFQHWFAFGNSDLGRVQIQTETSPGNWGNTNTINTEIFNDNNSIGAWTTTMIDISRYKGQKVRLRFVLFPNGSGMSDAGWYIDDLSIAVTSSKETMPYTENFENGMTEWWTDNGIWQFGTPSGDTGPDSCVSGSGCAGTTLSGNYPDNMESDLVSPSILLPDIAANEEIQLRFQHWFSFGNNNQGRVQIQTETSPGIWSNISVINTELFNDDNSIGAWTTTMIDISRYKGQKVRLRFVLFPNGSGMSDAGWYIDDLSIAVTSSKETMPYTENFENGMTEWWTDNGIWQFGTPSGDTGPDSCVSGSGCAGTTLSGNYPDNMESDLVSPSILLPDIAANEEIQLRFQHWFSFGNNNQGRVQIQTETSPGIWSNISVINTELFNDDNPTGDWEEAMIDISRYKGQKVRLRFVLFPSGSGSTDAGWYIDDLSIFVQ